MSEIADRLAEYEGPLTEFAELVREYLGGELLQRFEATYAREHSVKYIPIAEGRICTRCGATVSLDARKHHVLWHKQLTMTIWAVEGLQLAGMVKDGKPVEDEELEEL
jgi:hypothetical protein